MYDSFFFFFNDTATTEIYTLSLHDALPILSARLPEPERRLYHRDDAGCSHALVVVGRAGTHVYVRVDRKSTRLNSSHANISYAVFCLKKKKNIYLTHHYLYTRYDRHSSI